MSLPSPQSDVAWKHSCSHMEASHQSHQRPTSARTLAERVTLYCRQTTAAHNAAMVRSVVKPTAAEMTEYIQTHGPHQIYGDPTLVRVLLTDGEYDDACRANLNLKEAIAWHRQTAREYQPDSGDDESVLPLERSSSALNVMLQSLHVFSEEQIKAAQEDLASDDIVQLQAATRGVKCAPTDSCSDESDTFSQESVSDKSESGEEEANISGGDTTSEDNDGREAQQEERSCPKSARNECDAVEEAFGEHGEVIPIVSGAIPPDGASSLTEDENSSIEERDALCQMCTDEVCDVIPQEGNRIVTPVTVAQGSDDCFQLLSALLDDMSMTVEAAVTANEGSYVNRRGKYVNRRDVIMCKSTMNEVSAVERDSNVCDEHLINDTTLVARLVEAVDVEILKDGGDLDRDERVIEEDAAVLQRRFSASVAPHSSVREGFDRFSDSSIHRSTIAQDDSPIVHASSIEHESDRLALPTEEEGLALQPDSEAVHAHSEKNSSTNSVIEGDHPTQAQSTTETAIEYRYPFMIGDEVEAQYRGWSQFYAGAIVQAHEDGTYDILYADGDHEDHVQAVLIRQRAREEVVMSSSETPFVGKLETIHDGRDTVVGENEIEDMKNDHFQSSTILKHHCHPDTASSTTSSVVDPQEDENPAKQVRCPMIQDTSNTSMLVELFVRLPRQTYRVGDRVHVSQVVRRRVPGWIVGVRQTGGEEVYDVLYDHVVEGSVGAQKEFGVHGDRIERLVGEPMNVGDEAGSTEQKTDITSNQYTHRAQWAVETTPVVPFKRQKSQVESLPPEIEVAHAIAFENVGEDDGNMTSPKGSTASDFDDEIGSMRDDEVVQAAVRLVRNASNKSEATSVRPLTASMHNQGRTPRKSKNATMRSTSFRHDRPAEQPVVLSKATMRYLTPKTRNSLSISTSRPKSGPQATPCSQPKPKRSTADTVSWKELEEWKNVDLILSRKRRVVNHGHIEGSDVPWGEEFAAIQSLKRFATQYPDVLRQHIECQLCEVVNTTISSGQTARPMTSSTTSAARDALYLIKDLAFLLRQRLSAFFDVILPVVLPAVFHSHKRFLCETAYEVLEALVTHCSCRKLVVTLLRQALRFPRDDLRLVNLTCLYVEKCIQVRSSTILHELMTRSGGFILEATAELLTCKSAACQSSLQKCLWAIKQAVGEDAMERHVDAHLIGNSRVTVRRHMQAAEASGLGGSTRSPQPSPNKGSGSTGTPTKNTGPVVRAPQGSSTGGPSILQRMLAQRQNRVVPAPE